VQIQCTIALLSDAQTEGSLLRLNHDCHTIMEKHITIPMTTPAQQAYGQPSQESPKNIRDKPVDG